MYNVACGLFYVLSFLFEVVILWFYSVFCCNFWVFWYFQAFWFWCSFLYFGLDLLLFLGSWGFVYCLFFLLQFWWEFVVMFEVVVVDVFIIFGVGSRFLSVCVCWVFSFIYGLFHFFFWMLSALHVYVLEDGLWVLGERELCGWVLWIIFVVCCAGRLGWKIEEQSITAKRHRSAEGLTEEINAFSFYLFDEWFASVVHSYAIIVMPKCTRFLLIQTSISPYVQLVISRHLDD